MIYTSEQVGYGHPDKAADQVSDAILDAYLSVDRNARVAVETFIKDGHVVLGGEVKSNSSVDVEGIAREKLNDIYPYNNGFVDDKTAKYGDACTIDNFIGVQSSDIALGTDDGGAGDQGIVTGYAERGTGTLLPRSYDLATHLLMELCSIELDGIELGSDMKSQVTLNESGDILISNVSAHHSEADPKKVSELLSDAQRDILSPFGSLQDYVNYANHTGQFLLGGPWADCGLTGRKLVADTYGPHVPHGGGAFSGKDPSKVDRSGAYMARNVAKQIVTKWDVENALVSVAYVIGRREPVSVEVKLTGSIASSETKVAEVTEFARSFDWSPMGIDEYLGLRDFTRYSDTAYFGHFTNQSFPWEKVD